MSEWRSGGGSGSGDETFAETRRDPFAPAGRSRSFGGDPGGRIPPYRPPSTGGGGGPWEWFLGLPFIARIIAAGAVLGVVFALVLVLVFSLGDDDGDGRTAGVTETQEETPTPSVTPTGSPTGTATSTASATPSATGTAGASPTATSSPSGGSGTYTVQEGDTCGGIAASEGVSVADIIAANPEVNSACTNLQVGQVLQIVPGAGAAGTPTPTATATATPTATATATATASPTATGTPTNCDPHYVGVCVPPPPPDLGCEDVPDDDKPFLAPGDDPHGFDPDNDGLACEPGP